MSRTVVGLAIATVQVLGMAGFNTAAHAGGGNSCFLSVDDVSQPEGNAGMTAFFFTVKLTGTCVGTVTFDFATSDGTATSPEDYTAVTRTGVSVSTGPFDVFVVFNVFVNGDMTPPVESNETFFVTISNAMGSGVAITKATGTGTIIETISPTTSTIPTTTTTTGRTTTTTTVPTTTTTTVRAYPLAVDLAGPGGPTLPAIDNGSPQGGGGGPSVTLVIAAVLSLVVLKVVVARRFRSRRSAV